ncbi:predicted protein [Sclerotinia sclerotiorum 1980 UF-70]|uniref:Uncharacterized protein n=1 Tax=Sclerotinia sclerotiorum (strain ATCC 18683 / 1980 / Ss-1) TaxID=665079 RepID=A7EYV7_SCLS1|nr:predicted protein [Sclerotinia sclerotiorum 1980 UF-70]EDN94649.1 predicted protein [Sclerotinia sclerotiorum 1980 UF-70]
MAPTVHSPFTSSSQEQFCPERRAIFWCMLDSSLSIGISHLGATMVDLAMHGNEKTSIPEQCNLSP